MNFEMIGPLPYYRFTWDDLIVVNSVFKHMDRQRRRGNRTDTLPVHSGTASVFLDDYNPHLRDEHHSVRWIIGEDGEVTATPPLSVPLLTDIIKYGLDETCRPEGEEIIGALLLGPVTDTSHVTTDIELSLLDLEDGLKSRYDILARH